jgi:hypothetical protein
MRSWVDAQLGRPRPGDAFLPMRFWVDAQWGRAGPGDALLGRCASGPMRFWADAWADAHLGPTRPGRRAPGPTRPWADPRPRASRVEPGRLVRRARVTMAAVTEPGYSPPPPAAPPRPAGRRRVFIGAVVAWIVILVGLAVWSVRHDPPTVPEQRDIQQALPELQRAVGVVFAAASGPGRAAVLGDLQAAQDCRITPVRAGILAVRDVTVHVRAGEARAAVDAIAAALPKNYRATVSAGRGGTRFALHADAGEFIGIDASSDAGAQVLTLRASTDCRPLGSGPLDRSDPAAGPPPAVLDATLRALGAPGVAGRAGSPAGGSLSGGPSVPAVSGAPAGAAGQGGTGEGVVVRAVACPGGGTAASYLVQGVAAPADLGRSLRSVVSGASVIRADPAVWAYRTGNDSVVIEVDARRLSVTASTSC